MLELSHRCRWLLCVLRVLLERGLEHHPPARCTVPRHSEVRVGIKGWMLSSKCSASHRLLATGAEMGCVLLFLMDLWLREQGSEVLPSLSAAAIKAQSNVAVMKPLGLNLRLSLSPPLAVLGEEVRPSVPCRAVGARPLR